MKVRSVIIKVVNLYDDVETVAFTEGENGVVDLHYIVRDGMVCANSRIDGSREGYSVPIGRVISVRTIL